MSSDTYLQIQRRCKICISDDFQFLAEYTESNYLYTAYKNLHSHIEYIPNYNQMWSSLVLNISTCRLCQNARIAPNDYSRLVDVSCFLFSNFFGSIQIVKISWGIVRPFLRISIYRFFRIKNEDFYYAIYKLKFIPGTQRNTRNSSFSNSNAKSIAFCQKPLFRLSEISQYF